VFISASEHGRLPAVLGALEQTPVLTVSDAADFAARGGIIQFIMVGKRVRFEVNLAPAEQVGLTLRSDLLRVAVAVRRSASDE
jgi:hypothetical protein